MISILSIPKGEVALFITDDFKRSITDIETVIKHYGQGAPEVKFSAGQVTLPTGAILKMVRPRREAVMGAKGTVFIFRDTIRGMASRDMGDIEDYLASRGLKVQTFDEEWWPIDSKLRKEWAKKHGRK